MRKINDLLEAVDISTKSAELCDSKKKKKKEPQGNVEA